MDPRELQINKFELLHALRSDVASECKIRKSERINQKAADRKQGKSTLTPRKSTPVKAGDKWISHAEKKQAETRLNELMDAFALAVVSQAPIKRFDTIVTRCKELERSIPKSGLDFIDEVDVFYGRIVAFRDRILGVNNKDPSHVGPSSNSSLPARSPQRSPRLPENMSAGFVSPISPSEPSQLAQRRKPDTTAMQLSPIMSPDHDFELSKSTLHPAAPAPPIAPSPAPFPKYGTSLPPASSSSSSSTSSHTAVPIVSTDANVSTREMHLVASSSHTLHQRSPREQSDNATSVIMAADMYMQKDASPTASSKSRTLEVSFHSNSSADRSEKVVSPISIEKKDAAVQNDTPEKSHPSLEEIASMPMIGQEQDRYEREKLLLELKNMELEMSHARTLAQEQLSRVRTREVQRAKRILEETERDRVIRQMDVQEDDMRREIQCLRAEIDSVSSMLKSQLEITKMLMQPAQASSSASSSAASVLSARDYERSHREPRDESRSLEKVDTPVLEAVPSGGSRTTVTTTITTTTTSTPMRHTNSQVHGAQLHAQALALAASQSNLSVAVPAAVHEFPVSVYALPAAHSAPSGRTSSLSTAHTEADTQTPSVPQEQLSEHLAEDEDVATLDSSTDISRLLLGFRSGHLSESERRALIARARTKH